MDASTLANTTLIDLLRNTQKILTRDGKTLLLQHGGAVIQLVDRPKDVWVKELEFFKAG